MNILELLKSWIPTGTEVHIGGMVSAIGTVLTYFMGWDDAVEALLVLMVLDYITGMLAAYINPNLQLNSERGLRGMSL